MNEKLTDRETDRQSDRQTEIAAIPALFSVGVDCNSQFTRGCAACVKCS